MKIHLVGSHQYPARLGGVAAARVADCLAKGLGELGHEVKYQLPYAPLAPPPEGVQIVHQPPLDADVKWINGFERTKLQRTPWIPSLNTVHAADRSWAQYVNDQWLFVSASHAAFYGRTRYVLNGIDPGELCYGRPKQDYFLFMMADLLQMEAKGYQTVRDLVRECGIRLVVAGAISEEGKAQHYRQIFAEDGVQYVGHVSGRRKAELLAGARALFFPAHPNEAFGLLIAEALMSGTPVICSNRGACPELVQPETGFVCSTFDDYCLAVAQVDRISPLACRIFALENYHYLRMARDYVAEFEKEIASDVVSGAAELRRCLRWVEQEFQGGHSRNVPA